MLNLYNNVKVYAYMCKWSTVVTNLIKNCVFKKLQMNSASGDPTGGRDFAVPSPTPPPTDFIRASATPPPAHVWKSVSSQHRKSSKAVRV